ncbi:unnamed protein product [Linum trigynum]|uniref:RNase H type-1 domain-containing protein n=1 Tax=Linum trigynum TaxID=586398 RepID=A0AAV2DD87_9ROSI
MQLSNFIETAQTVNFSLWWRHVMVSETSPFHILQCVRLLWRIWKSRNKVTFEFSQTVLQPGPRISSLLLPPPPRSSLLPNLPATTWVPPPEGFLKINVDAAVCASGCLSGLVIRGSDGHVMLAFGLQHQGIVNPYLAELLAFRDAISFVASRSLTHVIVEGDSEVVVNEDRQGILEDSIGGPVLREYLQILSSLFVCIEFRAVPRSANSAAYRVARKALLLSRVELESFDFGVFRVF